MKRLLSCCLLAIGLLFSSEQLMAQGGCTTELESIADGNLDEVSKEYLRLKSYNNPYCDTTGSVFQALTLQLEKQLVATSASKEKVLSSMGSPYYQGPLADYENQKVTIGRDGKPSGKALPPAYKIPTGEYYIVYLWRKKDYLVFAFKGGKVIESRWWEKGNYR